VNAAPVWPWVAIALLGAWHGVNPGMGWLFAAALGMQEGKGSAAWRALPPLALGHALAVAVSLGAALLLGLAVSPTALRWTIGTVLVGYGTFRAIRSAHPRWGGMRVGPRGLTIWSFLMASAHGAGLMVLPFFVAGARAPAPGAAPHAGDAHLHHLPSVDPAAAALTSPEAFDAAAAVLLHTGAYLLVTGLVAVAVVHWLGLRLLRTLWVDLDRIWAATLIATGILAVLL
jgi:hypothetical protein